MLSPRVIGGLLAAISLFGTTYCFFALGVDIPFLLPSSFTSHPFTVPQPSESSNRHLTAEQCVERYPDLYLEADRAERWYSGKGGITEAMVDSAEKDDSNARLAILDNIVSVSCESG
jgi:hypothetical protein